MTRLSDLTGAVRRRTRTYDVSDLLAIVTYLEEYLVPVGSVIAKLTDSSPGQAWIRMTGQAVSKSEYPELYAEIGGMFGETATTFNLPDMTDTYLSGVGALTAGGTAGANSLTLTTGQLPAHSHGVTDPGHTHTFTGTPHGHTVTDPGHSHGITDPGHTHNTNRIDAMNAAAGSAENSVKASPLEPTGSSTTGISVNSATTGLTVDNATAGGSNASNTTGITTQNAGSGDSIDKRPKTMAMHYFIKARI